MRRILPAIFAGSFLWAFPLHAQIPGFTPDQAITYKSTPEVADLYLEVFTPPGHAATDSRPAIVFFHGGAWRTGSITQFHAQSEYLASRGMVAMCARYRLTPEVEPGYTGADPSTAPQKCVQDAKSAIRYVRQNAAALGIDPTRIAAGGGSAGGQMAAAAGNLILYDEPGENLGISSKPDALVLHNPVYNNGPVNGWQYDVCINYWESFSPMNNITPNSPPTIVFLGTQDNLIPSSVALEYQSLMQAAGARCDLHLYEGQGHGGSNYGRAAYYDSLLRTDQFLVSLGFLEEANFSRSAVDDWVTIYGDAAFSDGSELSASPVTTDANQDCIASNIPAATLAEGDFIQLTGTVTLDAPLSSGNFQVGLFHGDNPVIAGSGTGYSGFWAEAPGTSSTSIKFDQVAPQGDVTEAFEGTAGTSIIGTATTTGGQTWNGADVVDADGSLGTVNHSAYFPFTAEAGRDYRISLDVNLDVYTGANRYMSVGFFRQAPVSSRHNSSGVGGAFMQHVPNVGLLYAKYNNAEQTEPATVTFANWYTMEILLTCAPDGQSYTVNYSYTDHHSGVSTSMGEVTIDSPISEMTHAGISGDPRNQTGFVDNFLLTIDGGSSGPGSYPFDPSSAASLGMIAAAGAEVPANTPIDFTLLISRRVDVLDVSAVFTAPNGYHSSQNIVNNAATAKYFTDGGCTLGFDTAAMMMNGGTTGSFSNIQVTRGHLKVPSTFLKCAHDGGTLSFSWKSREAHAYRLKSSDTLLRPIGAWTNALTTSVSGTAPTNSLSIPRPAADRQFYIIEELYPD